MKEGFNKKNCIKNNELITKQMLIRVKPYAHQENAYNFAIEKFENGYKGVAYLMDMGIGKTITSIAVIGRLFKDGRITKIMIAAPKSILGVWEEEFQKYADFEFELENLSTKNKYKNDFLDKRKL